MEHHQREKPENRTSEANLERCPQTPYSWKKRKLSQEEIEEEISVKAISEKSEPILEKIIEFGNNLEKLEEILQVLLEALELTETVRDTIVATKAQIELEGKKLELARKRLTWVKEFQQDRLNLTSDVKKQVEKKVVQTGTIHPSHVVPVKLPIFRETDRQEEPVEFLEKF